MLKFEALAYGKGTRMSKAGRRVVAAAMSIVLAFSMVSVTALTAFADQLRSASFGAQATSGELVYDSVYGVFGQEYALMYKDVTYETVYGTGGQVGARTGRVADLVRADGQVMVHTSDVPESNTDQPGGYTDLQLSNLGLYSADIDQGFVKVVSKATGKTGLKRVESGADLVPCTYDSLSRNQNGGFIGMAYSGAEARVDFFTADGSPQGSVSLPINLRSDGEFSYRYVAYTFFRDYVGACVQESYRISSSATSESSYPTYVTEHSYAVAKLTGAGYVKDVETIALYAVNDGGALVLKSDGNIYYKTPDKGDALVASASGVASVRFENNVGIYMRDSESQYSE